MEMILRLLVQYKTSVHVGKDRWVRVAVCIIDVDCRYVARSMDRVVPDRPYVSAVPLQGRANSTTTTDG